ncbi:MAG: hypothetical protein R2754_09675 [Microthrixaceae bacterium]
MSDPSPSTLAPERSTVALAQVLRRVATDPPNPVGAEDLDALLHLLEGAARQAVDGLPADALPLRAPKAAIADALRCPRFALARRGLPFGEGQPDAQAKRRRGIAADLLVSHLLAGGDLAGDPRQLVLGAWTARGEHDELAALEQADDAERTRFETDCAELAEALRADWQGATGLVIDAAWWPRTQTTATLALADGDVLVSVRPDVELGGPAARLPPVIVEVKATALGNEHTFDLNLYALLVSLRDGRTPGALLHWSPANGWVELPPVTADVVESAARRLADAIGQLGALARGEPPQERPGAHCAWCPDAQVCPTSASTGRS